VGAMKGVILSINPSAQIVDITHDIPPQDIEAGAFDLLASYKVFPASTIHLAVIDPGVGSNRRPLLIQCAEQFFVGPDNGIFSWIYEREAKFRATQLSNEKFFRHPVSATFHGRDIFAPVAAALSTGIPIEEFGHEVKDVVRLESLAPKTAGANVVEGRLIHIDRFGNCITNLTRDHLREDPSDSRPKLVVNDREITSFHRYFVEGENDESELFCLFGSAGFLEVAARKSSAARILNARRGQSAVLISGHGD